MKLENTTLARVSRIRLAPFTDHRGTYVETYNELFFEKHGLPIHFVQDDISRSTRGVLRGIHGDHKTWKLVSCLLGEFYLVVIDLDPSSPTYLRWEGFDFSEDCDFQILVPPSHGLAHQALSPRIIFQYKQSTYYDRGSQFTIPWNDPRFAINWPIPNPITSERDSGVKESENE